ncbi:MAG: hypothetical protein ABS85_00995 [Sphingobacteriales bacterium SCN 48-20]|jgi:hypothetical protein|nr:MAG: hypothetical protein ABS85_00995 [Sphingobacteriales bacterium SCN 48-20]OJW44415.1 MAG: hypothetical protein BGO56_07100 [Sphingobacteriales bacterium 48-107]
MIMKKVFFACAIAVSAIAFATTNSGAIKSEKFNQTYQDTVPKDTTVPDTTKTPPSVFFQQ